MITSGSYGYRMQKAIALAYFRTPIADDDEMGILGRRVPTRVTLPLKRNHHRPSDTSDRCECADLANACHPGASRDPDMQEFFRRFNWIPACAGMTDFGVSDCCTRSSACVAVRRIGMTFWGGPHRFRGGDISLNCFGEFRGRCVRRTKWHRSCTTSIPRRRPRLRRRYCSGYRFPIALPTRWSWCRPTGR